MNAQDLSATLSRIGWTRRELSRRLGYKSEKSIRQWRVVPLDVEAWLQDVTWSIERLPVPKRGEK